MNPGWYVTDSGRTHYFDGVARGSLCGYFLGSMGDEMEPEDPSRPHLRCRACQRRAPYTATPLALVIDDVAVELTAEQRAELLEWWRGVQRRIRNPT